MLKLIYKWFLYSRTEWYSPRAANHCFYIFPCFLVVDQVDKELKEGVAKGFFEAVEADKRKASPPRVPSAYKRWLHYDAQEPTG